MKIILTSVGTRGDMEPMLAIASILKEKEHQVICAFPEQFRALAEDSGLDFFSLGSSYIELLDSEDGKAAMGGESGYKKLVGTLRLAKNQTPANKELLFKQAEIINREKPDRVVYNGKAVYPILWKLIYGQKTIFLSPLPYMHYVKGHTHIAFNNNYGAFFNKLTFSLADFGMVTTIKMCEKWLKIETKSSRKDIRRVIQTNKSMYTISPTLFPQPDNWNENLRVLGYHKENKENEWKASKELESFIEKHDKIVFITFGSMINSNPEEKTRIILDIVERNKIPSIINTASGGLIEPDQYNSDLVHFVSQLPYEWIFPKIYGVIHHGGSGTTHLALKYGCASMIIPHIIDQFVWNRILSDMGVGPKGIKISKISIKNLESKIVDLVHQNSYKEKAEEAGKQMNKENFEEQLYNWIKE